MQNESKVVSSLLQDSGNKEWYTPSDIIEAARVCMGGISLDPFSSDIANETVKADYFFNENDDGFSKNWTGKVWCNHPFSRENNKRIADKVIYEYENGNVESVCMITFAATSEKWFEKLLIQPQCYLHGRTNYFDMNGNRVNGVTKGSVVSYFGKDVGKFYECFKGLGTVKVQYAT